HYISMSPSSHCDDIKAMNNFLPMLAIRQGLLIYQILYSKEDETGEPGITGPTEEEGAPELHVTTCLRIIFRFPLIKVPAKT
ncbi:hypothetical protein L9F63_000210, partial [Diploptera punctata]